jgi:hypothetical protein
VKHRIELNDGPFDGLQLVSEADLSEQMQSLAIEYIHPDNENDRSPLNLQSAKYDLTDTDDSTGECIHRFHHDKTMPLKSPVTTDLWSKCQAWMTTGDRERWNDWRYEIFEAAEHCREVTRQYGDEEANEAIDTFQTLVLQIPFMEPVNDR